MSKKTKPKTRLAKVARVVVYVEKTRRGWKRITEARYRKLKGPPRVRTPSFGNSADYHDTNHDPFG